MPEYDSRPDRAGRKGVVVYMQPEFVKSLRRIAVELDTTLQEIGVEAFEAWVATNHLRIKAVGLGKEIIKMSSKDFQKVTK